MIMSKEPKARIIIVSGAPVNHAMKDSGAITIIPKPVDLDRLYNALYDAGAESTPTKLDDAAEE
jgi:hypothetical protein